MATEIRFRNSAQVQRQIDDAIRVLGHPEPLLKAWGVTVLAWVGQTFRAGGRPPWKPLAASTIRARRGKGGGKPLVNTGAYRNSFDLRVSEHAVVVFSDNPVAPWHEFGTRGPYPIVAKNAKALAIPGLQEGHQFSFSGLGRARRTASGGRLVAASGPRAGKTVAPFSGMTFRKRVMHPGLAARPVFPTPEQITPQLIAVGERLILSQLQRRGGGGTLPAASVG